MLDALSKASTLIQTLLGFDQQAAAAQLRALAAAEKLLQSVRAAMAAAPGHAGQAGSSSGPSSTLDTIISWPLAQAAVLAIRKVARLLGPQLHAAGAMALMEQVMQVRGLHMVM